MKTEDFLNNKINKEDIECFLNSNSLESNVSNLIYIYHFNKNIDKEIEKENKEILKNQFLKIFEKGFSWQLLKESEIFLDKNKTKTKKIKEFNVFFFKKLVSESFHQYFFKELNKKNSKDLKIFIDLALKSEVLTIDEISTIWNCYELDKKENIKDRDSFIKNIQNFSFMEKICLKFNLSPWTIISKDEKKETFLATQVWQNENRFLPKKKESTSLEYIKNLFIRDMKIWKKLETQTTKKIDLQSRIVFATANIPNEHHFNKLLKEFDIKEVNLNCLDYIDSIKNEMILKNKLLEYGKIKTIGKFDKQNHNKSEISPEILITSVPNKANLISNKKSFLKQWLLVNNNINYEKILDKVLLSKFKKYSGSTIDIKCYLPISANVIEEKKEYFTKQKSNYFNKDFIDFGEFGHDVSLKSFKNLLIWLKDKDINFKYINENENLLINEFILTISKFSTEFQPLIETIFEKDSILVKYLKNNTKIENKELFTYFINNFNNIWTNSLEKDHKDNILYYKYQKQSILFNTLNLFLEHIDCFEFSEELTNKNWNNFKNVLSVFEVDNEFIKSINQKINFIELNDKLHINKNNNKKINKI